MKLISLYRFFFLKAIWYDCGYNVGKVISGEFYYLQAFHALVCCLPCDLFVYATPTRAKLAADSPLNCHTKLPWPRHKYDYECECECAYSHDFNLRIDSYF